MDKKTITFRSDPRVYKALCSAAKKAGIKKGEAIENAMRDYSTKLGLLKVTA